MSQARDFGIGIIGTGHALGSRVQSNEELCSTTLDSRSPAWIIEKTGIRQRHLLGPGESATGLAVAAARQALAAAGVEASQLGLIVVATFSNEYLFPSLASRLHRELGASRAQTLDVQANCTGFVVATTLASDRMMRDSEVEYALVLGVEVLSPFVDFTDPETAIFFSDGAGAAVLGRVPESRGVRASAFHTDSSNYDSVRVRGGGSSFPYAARSPDATPGPGNPGFMEQNGLATWRQAVTHLPTTIKRACEKSGVALEDVDLVIFHQANVHIIEYAMKKMKLGVDRTFMNVQDVGNSGAASLPIALSDAVRAGRLRDGACVVLAGVGAGFNFGASVWTWHAPETPELGR